MKANLPAIAAILSLSATAAFAGPAADAARMHFEAIAQGSGAAAEGYAEDARFVWIGGPLDGSYSGREAIRALWSKFAKAQGPLKLTIDRLDESANDKGATVVANVQFQGKQTIKVRYVLSYRGGQVVSETWQIDPKLMVSSY